MKTLGAPRSVAVIATGRLQRRCHALLERAGERPVLSRGTRLAGARRLLRVHRPPVVLLDAVASPLRALLLLPRLKRAHPASRVILVGGAPLPADALLAGLRLGTCGHIATRDLARDLSRAVQRVRAGEPWLPRHLTPLIVAHLRGAPPASATPRLRLIRDRGTRISEGTGAARAAGLRRPVAHQGVRT